MDKVKMISTGTHRYEGAWLYNGDPFEANNDKDADELKILGFATRVPAKQTYETRVLVAEQPGAPATAATTADADAPRQKRAYTRRNLVADGAASE